MSCYMRKGLYLKTLRLERLFGLSWWICSNHLTLEQQKLFPSCGQRVEATQESERCTVLALKMEGVLKDKLKHINIFKSLSIH